MSFFSVKSMSAGYGKERILSDLSFDMDSGTLLGVIGANGSGKTTLLKSICGILPHGGTCSLKHRILEGQSPRQMARLCSYIPQRSGISIDISVLDVVLMGFNPYLGLLEHPDNTMKETAMRVLDQVGLSGKEQMNYLHLSEGQKQLCILARTLVSDSSLLLLDEPESALDFRLRHQVLEILRRWSMEGERGAIVTLHDPVLALNYCDRLLLLSDGEILGVISPRTDSLDHMEKMLGGVYGRVSLQICKNRGGKIQLVMLKEEEG